MSFPPTLMAALERIASHSQRALDRLSVLRPKNVVLPILSSRPPPPDHVARRLEDVFDALSDLPLQPNVAAACELACEVLQAELPTGFLAIALHDIDEDEMRFVVAEGDGGDILKGTGMSVAECLTGHAVYDVVLTDGGPEGAAWLGAEGADSPVMLSPILHDAALLGMIGLADPVCAAEFCDHDVELVRYVSSQLAEFIHVQRQRPLEEPPAAASAAG